ncbi:hypothetical protein GRI38_00315 [Altererythrobacter aurantiacus]|uniref:Ubiquinol-cytochrome c chaperone domain-containing protein n=1 Tax=Parapontixanthobacter aurantiacus TaxID=1463599 RepID=A0A844Z777_9SPHN|nr:ubiquinol-cytochrome C chaperone family protein [Parapontixanthobacter aurantiacus]MXO84481.1 hypothetical protein [Parapontixanthobacter aurantiacus]
MALSIGKKISGWLGTGQDPREELRPLWHHVVGLARKEVWFREAGVADSVAGRFDIITSILSLTVLRMENSPELSRKTALLTELFVEDMDGQLREFGVGDVVVGKHVGRLMSVLGGRLGAYRAAFSGGSETLLAAATRNTTLAEEDRAPVLAEHLAQLRGNLAATSDEDILAGRFDL